MTQQRKYETLGPADGCQHLPQLAYRRIDHIDFTWMRAPQPTLILAAEKDFFDFKATQKAASEAQKLYSALGKPKSFGFFHSNDKHGFRKPRRQAMVQWMRRWLKNDPTAVSEIEITPQKEEKLLVTTSGQLLKEFDNEKSLADINKALAQKLASHRKAFAQKPRAEQIKTSDQQT